MELGIVFNTPINDRYFEDYVEGDIHRCGSVTVEADEVIAFAKRFDPQIFHLDPEAAKLTPFGGLIASGWHTGALTMRLLRITTSPKWPVWVLRALTSCIGSGQFAPLIPCRCT
jgi:acyl dehydratase